jgi:hypothetical protein
MSRDRIYPEWYLNETRDEYRKANGMYDQCGQVYHAKDIDKWSKPTKTYRYLVFINESKGHNTFYYYDEISRQAGLRHFKDMGIKEEQLVTLTHEEYMQFCKKD